MADVKQQQMNDAQTDKAGIEWLKKSFINVQRKLVLDIEMANGSITHPAVKGEVNEDHWLEIFRQYLPDRYQVTRGFVIDSKGGCSDQIDIIIYDRQYTPTLLDQQNHRYIPIEAVYAVFETKPEFSKKYFDYAGDKAASVRRLQPTSVSIVHAGGVYPPKEPIKIIAGIVAKSGWGSGLQDTFENNLPTEANMFLDCGCALEHGTFHFFDTVCHCTPDKDLTQWGRKTLTVYPKQFGKANLAVGGSLMTFLFRLLAQLQSMGTVPAIDWMAYSKILSEVEEV